MVSMSAFIEQKPISRQSFYRVNMRKILASIIIIFSASSAHSATLKGVEGTTMTITATQAEMEGMIIGHKYDVLTSEGDILAQFVLTKIVKGKGVVGKVIERSPLLEINDTIKLVPHKANKSKSNEEDDNEDENNETESPSATIDSKSTSDAKEFKKAKTFDRFNLSLAGGAHSFKGELINENYLSFVELRGAYHFENSKFAIGFFLSGNYVDSEIKDEDLTYAGLVAEYRENIGPWRILGSLQLGAGTYRLEPKESAVGLLWTERKGDASLLTLNVGANYHWDAFYLGVEYQIFGSHIVTVDDKDYELRSHGHSFLIGTSF